VVESGGQIRQQTPIAFLAYKHEAASRLIFRPPPFDGETLDSRCHRAE
jgi:hypothetical protein